MVLWIKGWFRDGSPQIEGVGLSWFQWCSYWALLKIQLLSNFCLKIHVDLIIIVSCNQYYVFCKKNSGCKEGHNEDQSSWHSW